VLILTAGAVESLLPTIVSRCEVLKLRPTPLEVLRSGLQTNWKVPSERAALLAHLSGGRPGYAVRLHEHPELLEQRQGYLDELGELVGASRAQRFAYIEDLTRDKDKSKENVRLMLLTWLPLWRDVLLRAAGSTATLVNVDREGTIQDLADRYGLDAAHRVVAALQRTLDSLDRNVNTRLAAEVLMLDLP
jgi:DNA polymerase-3 subunit delta'